MTNNKPKLIIVSGSARQNSLTRRVALNLNKAFSETFETKIIDLKDYALPVIETVWMTKEQAPEQFQELWENMNSADAFVFVSPEYNGSYSSAMKNLLDHMPKSAYQRKAIGIVTASPGGLGGVRAAQQLILLACGLFAVPSPTLLVTPFVDKKFDENGNLQDESFAIGVNTFVNDFSWLANSLTNSRK